jgi:hypothetical protein
MIKGPRYVGGFFIQYRTQTVRFRTPVCPCIRLQTLTGIQLQSGIGLEVSTAACIPHIYKKRYA